MTEQTHRTKSVTEKVFVGTWNAINPDRQGKAIMDAMDRWFQPNKLGKKDAQVADAMRPKIEKIVGWAALGAEVGLITLGLVKGYTYLKGQKVSPKENSIPVIIIPDKIPPPELGHPLLARMLELLKDEPFVDIALASGAVGIKSVIMKSHEGKRVSVSARNFPGKGNEEVSVDVLIPGNKTTDVFIFSEQRGSSHHVHMPLTREDLKNWPLILPSDELKAGVSGSDVHAFPIREDTIDMLTKLLDRAEPDEVATALRRGMMQKLSGNG